MWKDYQPGTFAEKVRLTIAQLRRPNELLYGAGVMTLVYSTPSLLFLATLSVAICAANWSDFYPQQSNKNSEFDGPATPTPQEQTAEGPLKTWREQSNKNSEFDAPATPTPRKSAEEILEVRP